MKQRLVWSMFLLIGLPLFFAWLGGTPKQADAQAEGYWQQISIELIEGDTSNGGAISLAPGAATILVTSSATADQFQASMSWTAPEPVYRPGDLVALTLSVSVDQYSWHGEHDGYFDYNGLNYVSATIAARIDHDDVPLGGVRSAVWLVDEAGNYSPEVKTDYGRVAIASQSYTVRAEFPAGYSEQRCAIYVNVYNSGIGGMARYTYEWVSQPQATIAATEPAPTEPILIPTPTPIPELMNIVGRVTTMIPAWKGTPPQRWVEISDNHLLPLRDVRVILLQEDKEQNEIVERQQTISQLDGSFGFYDLPEGDGWMIAVVLEHALHAPGESPYFQIFYDWRENDPTRQPLRFLTHPFSLDSNLDNTVVDGERYVRKDLRLDELSSLKVEPSGVLSPDQYASAGLIYYCVREGWHMAQLLLGQPLDLSPLPVSIFDTSRRGQQPKAFWDGPWIATGGHKYSNIQPRIALESEYSDSRYYDPCGVALHEFGHHLMADAFDNHFPSRAEVIDNPPTYTNHGGAKNACTSDSWTEGFATFFAAWTQRDSLSMSDPHLWWYGYHGSSAVANLEVNRISWLADHEETAVSALLWDLLDPIHDEDCTPFIAHSLPTGPSAGPQIQYAKYCDYVQMRSDDLWEILTSRRPSESPDAPGKYPFIFDMVDLYTRLRSEYDFYAVSYDWHETGEVTVTPNGLHPIDELFIAHGFFADVSPQNISYDPGEAIGFTSREEIIDNDGSLSLPAQIPRRSPPPLPDSYIGYELYDVKTGAAVAPTNADYFLIEVMFDAPHEYYNYSYTTHVATPGRLYYYGPPAIYSARTRITAHIADHVPAGESALEFSNEAYWQAVKAGQTGNFLEHAFLVESGGEYGQRSDLETILIAAAAIICLCILPGTVTALAIAAFLFRKKQQARANEAAP